MPFRALAVVLLALGAVVWTAAASSGPAGSSDTDRAANELGSVMILEYHRIGTPEGRWTRSPAGLRRDLELLWDSGYRPVSLNALVAGTIDVPAGASPFVLTFDDSSPGQFRYLERDGRLEIDPECAVAILEAFARGHALAAAPATFFVLPAADEPNRLFGQPEHEARKIRYLVAHGFELGNHTFWHADLSKYPESVVTAQLARAQQRIDHLVPGYRLRALSLPMGNYPKKLEWAIRGRAAGVSYDHEAILMVAGGPAPSPFSSRFDPHHLPRIQALAGTVMDWIGHFDRHPGERFVSDGDPATVTIQRGRQGDVRMRPGQTLRVAGPE
jgi:hypothetical protein